MVRGRFFFRRQVAAGGFVLLIAITGWVPVNQAEAQDVNEAMQSFIQAMVNKNPAAIAAAFSRQSPWRYQPYEIGTRRRLKPASITPDRMARDFQIKSGLYDFFWLNRMAIPFG